MGVLLARRVGVGGGGSVGAGVKVGGSCCGVIVGVGVGATVGMNTGRNCSIGLAWGLVKMVKKPKKTQTMPINKNRVRMFSRVPKQPPDRLDLLLLLICVFLRV
jgi:hypothetical protein